MRRRAAGASDRKHDGYGEREPEVGRVREGTRGKWRERETEGGTLGGSDEGRRSCVVSFCVMLCCIVLCSLVSCRVVSCFAALCRVGMCCVDVLRCFLWLWLWLWLW